MTSVVHSPFSRFAAQNLVELQRGSIQASKTISNECIEMRQGEKIFVLNLKVIAFSEIERKIPSWEEEGK